MHFSSNQCCTEHSVMGMKDETLFWCQYSDVPTSNSTLLLFRQLLNYSSSHPVRSPLVQIWGQLIRELKLEHKNLKQNLTGKHSRGKVKKKKTKKKQKTVDLIYITHWALLQALHNRGLATYRSINSMFTLYLGQLQLVLFVCSEGLHKIKYNAPSFYNIYRVVRFLQSISYDSQTVKS